MLIEVNKQELTGVKLKGGQAYSFTSSGADVPYTTAFLSRKNGVSFDVIAPTLNHVTIGYERLMGHRIALLVKAGYIGVWQGDPQESEVYGSKGGLLTAGVKFILPRSAKRTPPPRDAHPLAGWYLRPELMFSAWKGTYYQYDIFYDPLDYLEQTKFTSNYTSAALVLSIGREFFLGEHITFDISGGLGYGAEWRDGTANNSGDSNFRQQYAYSHVFTGTTSPLVLAGGLRFGYAF